MGKRKYSKKALPGFTDAQRRWAEDYEGKTGIEPMHLDEACDIGFDEFAKRNIGWFEDWTSEAMSLISSHVPYSDEDAGWRMQK